jgi:tetratricopeptide (TPR) repeat protein
LFLHAVGALVPCLVLLLAAPPPLADLLTRAQARIEQGDLSGARAELDRALRSFPANPLALNFLGVVEAQEGHYRAAESRFREAIRAGPRLTDAYLNLGRLYQEHSADDPEAVRKAAVVYETLLRSTPHHAEALYQSAVVLRATGEFARSLERLDRLGPEHQQRAQTLAVRCADEAGLGRGAEADRAADALLARPELSEADVLPILTTLRDHGREDLAVRLLEALRDRGRAGPEPLLQLAGAYERADRLDSARAALEAAAQAERRSVPILLEVARVARKAGDRQGALGYLAHARDLDPQDARVHFVFGLICMELDLGVEAYNSLKQAVTLAPEDPGINYAMGAVALHQRDASEAVPYFQKYVALKPDESRGSLGVGIAWFKAGNFQSARPELTRAARSASTAAAANYFLARIAREENDLDQALALVDTALQAKPDYADAWAERGLLHLRKRELDTAEKDLQRCLELDRDNYLGNLHLLSLYQRTKDPRQGEQARRIDELSARRDQKADEFRRVIEVRPY